MDVGINISKLKERIECMPKYHQIEVLRILTKHTTVKTNENNKAVIERKKREIEEFKEQATESCNDYLIPIKAYLQEIIKDKILLVEIRIINRKNLYEIFCKIHYITNSCCTI